MISNTHKIYAKVLLKTIIMWFVIFFTGLLLSLFSFIIALMLLSSNTVGDWYNITKIGESLKVLFHLAFFDTLLLISCFIFPVVYFVIARKYALLNGVYHLKNSLFNWEPKIEEYLNILESKYSDYNYSSNIKANLLHISKIDESGIGAFIRPLLNRINFDKFFKNDNGSLSISKFIIDQIHDYLNKFDKPKLTTFWLTVGLQIVLILTAIIL